MASKILRDSIIRLIVVILFFGVAFYINSNGNTMVTVSTFLGVMGFQTLVFMFIFNQIKDEIKNLSDTLQKTLDKLSRELSQSKKNQ